MVITLKIEIVNFIAPKSSEFNDEHNAIMTMAFAA